MGNIRLKIPGESFWAFQYPDLPANQAEINNYLFSDTYSFGDRVEFDEDRNVIRIVKTREEVMEEQKQIEKFPPNSGYNLSPGTLPQNETL